ncbi:anti-sigma regulatory factor [Desulfolucanica intricata]|uniref:anti-sigma regulatory factor n=1 Tax=Desulfolucanica intricata TaxID=1285191 RepID=UPI00082DE435|nr:anti-sigma regulatory factor [Desulfolucanica intricata]
MSKKCSLLIECEYDIIKARQAVKDIAVYLSFSLVDQVKMATAISELARNVVLYARKGSITIWAIEEGERQGLGAVVSDTGPGIQDVDLALTDGFTTSGGLGAGLPGVKRLMDEFNLQTKVGEGTTITVKKWKA